MNSPYFAMCLASYHVTLAIAVLYAYYGLEAVVPVLVVFL